MRLVQLGLEALNLLVPIVPFAFLQSAFRPQERPVEPFRQLVHRYIRFPGHLLQGIASQQELHDRQLPLRRKPQRRPGHSVAIASVLGARWRRRGLRHTRFQPNLSVHTPPPSIRSVAQCAVSGNRAPAYKEVAPDTYLPHVLLPSQQCNSASRAP